MCVCVSVYGKKEVEDGEETAEFAGYTRTLLRAKLGRAKRTETKSELNEF